MSYRNGDPNLLERITELFRRVGRLEREQVNVRRNDVRIGDLLMTWNGATNQLVLTNMATGAPPTVIAVP